MNACYTLEAPPQATEAVDALANGSAYALQRMPGVDCRRCGDVWVGRRVLPHPCPDAFKTSPLLTKRQPVPVREFQTLSRAIEIELSRGGMSAQLRPGDSFQPIVARVAQVCPDAFYWTSIGCPLVGKNVKDALENIGIRGATFLPVQTFLTSIAPHERAADLFAVPLISTLPTGRWTESPQALYLLLVAAESGLPKGSRVIRSCRTCGRTEIEHADRPFVMERSSMPDADIFLIQGTSIPAVTARVSERIRGFENVHLAELAVR